MDEQWLQLLHSEVLEFIILTLASTSADCYFHILFRFLPHAFRKRQQTGCIYSSRGVSRMVNISVEELLTYSD